MRAALLDNVRHERADLALEVRSTHDGPRSDDARTDRAQCAGKRFETAATAALDIHRGGDPDDLSFELAAADDPVNRVLQSPRQTSDGLLLRRSGPEVVVPLRNP